MKIFASLKRLTALNAPHLRIALAAPVFFAVKLAIGLLMINFSARYLSVGGFVVFSQFFLLLALVNMIASGGMQNGLIRQIASAKDAARQRLALRAALLIWLGVCVVVAPLSFILQNLIATILIADTRVSWLAPLIVCAGLAGGFGQIYCAMLTGLGRGASSILAQTIGLTFGGALSLALLYRGNAELAAPAFALGQIATGAFAWYVARGDADHHDDPIDTPGLTEQLRVLIGYSGAFFAIALLAPLALFVLRYIYQQRFGVEALGQWLIANRISDMTTQFLGVYMVQAFLPAVAASNSASHTARLVRNAFIIAVMGMCALVGVFSLAPALFIHLFLSDQYLVAQSAIQTYMAGDVLRVAPAIALHLALAQRRLRFAIASELLPVTLFFTTTLILIVKGLPDAPFIGYVGAYAATLIVMVIFWMRARREIV